MEKQDLDGPGSDPGEGVTEKRVSSDISSRGRGHTENRDKPVHGVLGGMEEVCRKNRESAEALS